jgi:hypothetical protein
MIFDEYAELWIIKKDGKYCYHLRIHYLVTSAQTPWQAHMHRTPVSGLHRN